MKLVFLHGSGCSGLSFYYQLRHFRTAKAIDLPGHPDGQPCRSIGGYVEWVRGFIRARRYKDVALCGHSMGGAIALQYALDYPEELRGLILLGSGARLRVHPDYLARGADPGADNAAWLETHLQYYRGVTEPDLYQVIAQRAAEIGPAVERNDLLACNEFDVMGRLPEIGLPALALCGSEDVMTPPKYTEYLAQQIPNAQMAVIPGGSHFVQLEQYQQVNAAIENFLSSLE